jgi:hypothetical protein
MIPAPPRKRQDGETISFTWAPSEWTGNGFTSFEKLGKGQVQFARFQYVLRRTNRHVGGAQWVYFVKTFDAPGAHFAQIPEEDIR